VKLTGLCQEGQRLESTLFQWQQPTSLGGDFIADTDSSEIAIQVGDDRCQLTGLAVVTDADAPALRLQFERCSGRAAVMVPLYSKEGGMKLMPWLCGVSSGSDLCGKAHAMASNTTLPTAPQATLDLTPLAEAASKGVLHTNAKSPCFEDLHWFVVSGGVGVDKDEWLLVKAVHSILKHKDPPVLKADADVQVEEVCFLSCDGDWDESKCGHKPFVMPVENLGAPPKPRPLVPASAVLSQQRLQKFQEELSSTDSGPWLWLTLIGAASLGIFVALLLLPLFRYQEPPKAGAPRVKQVDVLYPDSTKASAKLLK